jgi:hypothetical protein
VKEPLRVGSMFESHHGVIGIADHDHVARSMMLTPVPGPQVEDVVQVDVGQQR